MPHLDVVDQGETNWCWASVAAAVEKWRRGTDRRPCEVAGDVFNSAMCCERPSDFNQLQELSKVLDKLGLLHATQVGAMNESELAAELDKRPVGARMVFQNGRVHFVAITLSHADGTFTVVDPDGPVTHRLNHGELRFAYPGGGVWTESYLVR